MKLTHGLPASHLFSFIFLFSPFCVVVAQTGGNITLGSSLTARNDNSSWISPSGDFAFGFRPLDKDTFLLSIWYAKIPDTVVWYAAGDGTVIAPKDSIVVFDAERGLILTDSHGNTLWSPHTSSIPRYGSLTDSGNLVLSSKNDTLWQSFDDPRDTLLPTQTMRVGGNLNSRFSKSNFSMGRFQLRLRSSGELVLVVLNTRSSMVSNRSYDAVYYNTSISDSTTKLIYNGSGQMFLLTDNGTKTNLTPENVVSATKNYHRATLSFDGVLTWYYHPKDFNPRLPSDTSNWSATRSQPDDICLRLMGNVASGACGFNSICSLGNNQRPVCRCPQGYSLLDPSDENGNCKPNFDLSCNDQDGYRSVKLDQTDWPLTDYDRLDSVEVELCRTSCMNDCFCAVATFRDNTCWKKKLPFSNGRIDPNSVAFLKVKDVALTESPTPIRNIKAGLGRMFSALLGTSVFLNFILFAIICLGIIFMCRRQHKQASGIIATSEYNVHCFSYKELLAATDGFSKELGRGAFGIVYKGTILANNSTSSSTSVAVKKLEKLDGEREFKTEVNVIGQTHHKNLVRLIGFCDEGQHRLLVYEFMTIGSLSDFLFSEFKPSWTQRINIAQGIAAGLLYLHEECSTQIIHCDIKPQNILLDEYLNPRISDFGLAKLLMLGQSYTKTVIRGTKGYVALEWFRNKPVSAKVDVFSFGVLLLEIISCRKCLMVDMISGDESPILTDWASDCYQSGALETLVDNDMEALADRQRLERFVVAALWCVQDEPDMRPTMRKVTQMLDDVVQVSAPPPLG